MAATAAPVGARPGASAATVADVVPNPTLYCNNLNDRVQLSDLIANLYECFAAYGMVLDIVAGRKIRGQAFVVFSELSSATAAMRALQGKEFLGKPLHITYAKTKSDAYLKHIDQYKPRKPHAPRTAVVTTQAKGATPSEGKFSLFVENLPEKASKASLEILFSQYRGYADTRLVEGRGVAFVDFTTQPLAEVALQGLQGFKLTPRNPLRISHVDR